MADCKESKEEETRPPFLLKVDSPMDTSEDSTGNSENEDPPAESKEDRSAKLEMAEETPGKFEQEKSSQLELAGETPGELETDRRGQMLSKQRRPGRGNFTSQHKAIKRCRPRMEEPEDEPVLNETPEDSFENSTAEEKKRRVLFPFGSKDYPKPKHSVFLRPSQLGSIANSTAAPAKSVLRPAKFRNPFGSRAADESTMEEEAASENNGNEESKSKVEEKTSEDESPKFLPLATSTKDNEVNKDASNSGNSTVEATTSTPVFVFGQNLKERVAGAEGEDSEKSEEKTDEVQQEEPATENGSAELLFSTAASACRTTARPGLTLNEAAQELEEANRANKRMYSEVTPLTGEEGETNVLQVNCKLFAFDKATSGWQERGRGTLRLNDRDEESRLVIRTTGTQRVILNTKIWPAMTAERAGPKSLRLTAMDVNGDIRIFIVQAGPMETEQLHNLLLPRIKKAQERQP